jgi:hypothetical protein
VDDICDRLANGRPPVDGEYAEMTGDDALTEDDFYDRYELGEQAGDPRHEPGLRFELRDTITRQKYVITVLHIG